MLLAKNTDGRLIAAAPGLVEVCPGCGQQVVAKCGSIVAWHWAHRSADCDQWSEPMSAWHLEWQARFPLTQVEVVMRRDGQHHRADVVLGDGSVLELQASSISADETRSREAFYGRMQWLFRCDWSDRLLVIDEVPSRCSCCCCEGKDHMYYLHDATPDPVCERSEVLRVMNACDARWRSDQLMAARNEYSDEARRLIRNRAVSFAGCDLLLDTSALKLTSEHDDCIKARSDLGHLHVRWKARRKSHLALNRPAYWHRLDLDEVWRVIPVSAADHNIEVVGRWSTEEFAQLCLRAELPSTP